MESGARRVGSDHAAIQLSGDATAGVGAPTVR
jgi:hypothetical protein